jgi:hypothetical protein
LSFSHLRACTDEGKGISSIQKIMAMQGEVERQQNKKHGSKCSVKDSEHLIT